MSCFRLLLRPTHHEIGPNWYQTGNKTGYITKIGKFYVEKEYVNRLDLLDVSLNLIDQNIMQRGRKDGWRGMEQNFQCLGMQKLNISTDRAQRVDEKNGVICLVFMFSFGVIVIKISQMVHFFVFSADGSKTLVTVWAKYLRAPERSY